MGEHILICGLPGVGKTETAKAIAQTFVWAFLDTDEYIEDLYEKETGERTTRREIFKQLGDYGFRKMENQILAQLHAQEKIVIAMGGGTVTSKDNRGLVKSLGTVIYLTNDRKIIFERLMQKGGIPAYLNPESPRESFDLIANERELIYEELADIKFNTGKLTPLEIASEVTNLLLKQKR